jgi:hypothetical protein
MKPRRGDTHSAGGLSPRDNGHKSRMKNVECRMGNEESLNEEIFYEAPKGRYAFSRGREPPGTMAKNKSLAPEGRHYF